MFEQLELVKRLKQENQDLKAQRDELLDACEAAFNAIEALLKDKPMLAAKVCGSTTLGNHRAEIKQTIIRVRN